MELSYDVVIVGAGVAGSYAAYLLASKGLRVALIEAKPEDRIGYKVCGDAIGKHHVDAMGIELSMGREIVHTYRGAKVVSPSERFVVDVPGEGYALDRKAFGRKLVDLAVSKGADLYPSTRFSKPLIEGSWIQGVEATKNDGSRTRFLAKVVIDASGIVGVVRTSLPREWWVSEPIPREDINATYREIWVADVDMDPNDLHYVWIYLDPEHAPGGYWWFFPKARNVFNVGLGVQLKPGAPNPRHNFEQFIRKRFEKRIVEIVDRGGGLVPTRRPIPCMVWNGLVVVGDAAATANPVHGGGIGPALLSAKLASETIIEALEKGAASMENLWIYHRRYHQLYGAKQASLDILRMFLQKLGVEDLETLFSTGIANTASIYRLGVEGTIEASTIAKIKTVLTTMVRSPRALTILAKVKRYMDKLREHYLAYPEKPEGYPAWREEERRIVDEYRRWLENEFRGL